MGLFITVEIDHENCAKGCRECVDACPVDIFVLEDGRCAVAAENEDECTLCGICIERCGSNCIELIKNY